MAVFHPTAVPLLVSDPYFSVWSFTNCLTDDFPRHWTGRRQGMLGVLLIDGKPFRFLGKTGFFEEYVPQGNVLRQNTLKVTPTASIYTFSHPACDLKVTFLSPLLADRPDLLCRPASYVSYEIKPKQEGHTFTVYFDVTADFCGDECGQELVMRQKPGHAWMGNAVQNPLSGSGDDLRIDWGYLHLVHPNAQAGVAEHRNQFFKHYVSQTRKNRDLSKPVPFRCAPLLFATSENLADTFIVAYEDDVSVEYYHRKIPAYYKKVYGSFDKMLQAVVREEREIRAICASFDRRFITEMNRISPAYARVCSLAYRQTIGAHKLVEIDGEPMFFSKENFSNGCMATLDVTYPSIPLFLRLNPDLARAMMRPIFAYARSEVWKFPFAPHDCGQYPLCNGQVYSVENGVPKADEQMPVEECGNAILVMATATAADGKREMAEQNRDLLTQWADYLVQYGYNPENQLCTDDFAGFLAHNCNLSLKAIVALGAYAKLFDAPEYAAKAKEMANRWVREAKRSGGGYRLTFDREDSWSLKYNLVWDRLLNLGLFEKSVGREEIAVYRKKMNRYGVPLDSRADYTKTDWLAWTTVIADDPSYTTDVYDALERMVSETDDRVPMTDWFGTKDARQQIGFQARSVVGGLFINLLLNRLNSL